MFVLVGVSRLSCILFCGRAPYRFLPLFFVCAFQNFVQLLSGDKMKKQIVVQLYDGWNNPTKTKGVSVVLLKEGTFKLSPYPQAVKTDSEGKARFPKFAITAKWLVFQSTRLRDA